MQNKIILDTDPGIDDAVAIILLLQECGERVAAIISSYGNISIEKTTKNTLAMLSLLGYDIPVIKGSTNPNNDKYIDAANIHGVDGLGGLQVKVTDKKAIEGDFLKLLYDEIITAAAVSGKVDYITLGPLTNLALLMKRFPDVCGYIDRIVTMGGGIDMGNVTEYAEFNIHCDGESADYVFENAKNLALVPLNVTTKVAFNLEQIADIGKIATPLSLAMEKILTANYLSCVKFGEPGSVMHDSTAVLFYLFPELFEAKKCGIGVDLKLHYGKTYLKEDIGNITLITKTDTEECLKKITDCIIKAN